MKNTAWVVGAFIGLVGLFSAWPTIAESVRKIDAVMTVGESIQRLDKSITEGKAERTHTSQQVQQVQQRMQQVQQQQQQIQQQQVTIEGKLDMLLEYFRSRPAPEQ